MKKVKQEDALNALAKLPPAPDGEMLAAFAKAMRVVAAKKTFDEMSVLDIVGASGFTARTFYNFGYMNFVYKLALAFRLAFYGLILLR